MIYQDCGFEGEHNQTNTQKHRRKKTWCKEKSARKITDYLLNFLLKDLAVWPPLHLGLKCDVFVDLLDEKQNADTASKCTLQSESYQVHRPPREVIKPQPGVNTVHTVCIHILQAVQRSLNSLHSLQTNQITQRHPQNHSPFPPVLTTFPLP